MCQFKSFIVLKNKIHWSLKTDSHGELLDELNIKDDSEFPNFVRVEFMPNGDIFNHNLANWNLNVDQDFRPDWFDKEKTYEEIRKIMEEVFQKQFCINSSREVSNQKIYIKNSSVEARGNSSVVAWENSSVVARENSSVEARGNSSVVAWENSSVVARENSSVVAWKNSSVEARENSSVVAWKNSSVEARENSSVVARENSSVVARENSSVVARENSSVEARGNSNIIIPKYSWCKIKSIHDLASIKDFNNNEILLCENGLKVKFLKDGEQ